MMIPVRLITLVLKSALIPYGVFRWVTDYAVTSLHINPTFAFVVSLAAAFGTLAVTVKIPI